MSDASLEHDDSPPPPASVDSICDVFESAWVAGYQPRIEDFLPPAGVVRDDGLLQELLLAEWELRRRHAQPVELQTYLERFAESRQSVVDAWHAYQAERREASDNGSVSGDATAFQTAPALEQVGTTIGRYKLLEKLGDGGFGTVWAAEQREPVKRRVALKLIKLGMDTRQVIARFEAERQALALMDHPNIAKVLDAGATETGSPYFVMELVRGIPITKYCEQERLPTQARLDLFMKVCNAIQHAHQKGIIHRDIKPSNILVTLHDGMPVPKVIDFGIAKATQQELTDKTIYTQLAQFIGTPAYMSPEQAEMSGLDIDTRSDIYSLGVLLYELLTGVTPFDAEELRSSGLDAMRKIIREREPLKPSSRLTKERQSAQSDGSARNPIKDSPWRTPAGHPAAGSRHPSIDRDLDWIVMKCLEKDRSRRYETANGLAADLKRHLQNEPVVARPPSAAYKFQKAWRRNKIAFVAGATVILALALGGAGSTWQAIVASQSRVKADLESKRAIANAQSAEAQKQKAEAATRRAEQQEDAMRRRAYAADMNVAHQAVRNNNLGRARELLNEYRPAEGQADLRGWEWRYLWGLCQSDALFQLCRFSNGVASTAIRPGGNWVAIGGDADGVEVWDLSARRRLAQLASGERFAHIAFSRDGSRLAFSTLQSLRVWDCATREVIAEVPLDPPPGGTTDTAIMSLTFSADGETLVTFQKSTAIHQWRASNLELLKSTPLPKGGGWHGTPFAVSSDLKTAAHFARGNGIVVIDLASGEERWRGNSPWGPGRAMAISPDGARLATSGGTGDGTIQIRDLATGDLVTELVGHRAWVGSLKFWPDGKTLVSSSADQTIRIWDLEQSKSIRTLQGHTLEVWSLDLSSDGSTLVSGSKNGEVLVWDSKGDPQKLSSWTMPGQHQGFRFSPDGKAIYTSERQTCRIFRYEGPTFARGAVMEEIQIEEGSFWTGSQSGRLLAVVTDRVLRMWNLDEGKLAYEFSVATNANQQFQPVAFSADETRLWIHHWDANGESSTLTEWDLTTKSPLRRITDPKSLKKFWWVHFHPDEWAIWIGDNYSIGFHDLRTGRTTRPEMAIGLFTSQSNVSSSADGKFMAFCHDAGFLSVWKTDSLLGSSAPSPLATLGGSVLSFSTSIFFPDGSRLSAGSTGEEAIKIWETRDYHEVLTLEANGTSFWSISLSANESILGALNAEGQLHLWRAPTWEEINAFEKTAEGAVSGQFTPVVRAAWDGELVQ